MVGEVEAGVSVEVIAREKKKGDLGWGWRGGSGGDEVMIGENRREKV